MEISEYLKAIGLALVPLALLLPVAIGLELASPKTRYGWRERLPGAVYVVFAPALITGLSWPLHHLWKSLGYQPVIDLSALSFPAKFLILLLAFDFLRYWEHRFEHRFWWPVHAVHHSPHDLHAANAYSHPLLALPELAIVVIPFSLIDPGGLAAPIAVWTFVAFQDLIIHSPLRLHAGRWRMFYVDSRYHRIHHSVEPRHWHHNFGFVFSFWDKLFGTAFPVGDRDWPATGVPGMAEVDGPTDYLTRPYRLWRERGLTSDTALIAAQRPNRIEVNTQP